MHVWCMRYKSKHSYFKHLARVIGNFKNIPKTLALRHQRYICYQMNEPSSYLQNSTSYGRRKLSFYIAEIHALYAAFFVIIVKHVYVAVPSRKRTLFDVSWSVVPGFIQEFLLEGGNFLEIVHWRMENRQCVKHAILGMPPPPPPPPGIFGKIAATEARFLRIYISSHAGLSECK